MTILIIASILALAGATWLILDARSKEKQAKEFDIERIAQVIYKECWTGRKDDRLYAWYRARKSVQVWFATNPDLHEDLLAYINRQVNQLQKEKRTSSYIDGNGRLILKSETTH